VPRTVWLRHELSLAHDVPGHPERPERILALEATMAHHDWFGCSVLDAPQASQDALRAVHPERHIRYIDELSAGGGGRVDLDTIAVEATYAAALRAAGGGVALVDALLTGEAATGFSALRPPGHHAENSRAMGFCLFANVAIAARHALSHGAKRVLVLDWDVHHGNGTNAIFHESREVLFASLHQYPFWPGSGALTDVGAGAGEGFSLNLPVPAGGGEDEYCGLVEHIVLPAARAFDPDLVLVSAGFDAHRDDPLGECTMETGSYAQLALLALTLGKPVGYVLEGGYELGALAASVAASMECLAEGGEPASFPRGELVEQAVGVLGRYWEV
jgi:acetoin utilization deacetylase AcuC-like enzyme